MAIKYIPYFPNTLEGQALLDNFVRTKRMLRYRDNDKVVERIERGMPLYEMDLKEKVGTNSNENLIVRGECVSTCAYLKDKGITVDLVYIDPPFASGADYAKKVYIRRNPKVAEAIRQTDSALDIEDLKAFEEKMYGDVWDKERYLNWMYENLMAIKSVMSDTASIYVHLDDHIGHYVKILMDEVFGEENFKNDISWRSTASHNDSNKSFSSISDHIYFYSLSNDNVFNTQYNPYSEEYIDSTEEEYDVITQRIWKKLQIIQTEYIKWFEVIVAIVVMIIGYYSPILLLIFQMKMRQMDMENEVMQFQTIILMLMKIERINVEMILEWLERYANIFKEPITRCVNNYEAGAWEALEQLKKDTTFPLFIRIVESLQAAVEKIPIRQAFDELDTERDYYQEKRKQSRLLLRKKRAIMKI